MFFKLNLLYFIFDLGTCPRNFNISDCGKYLIVANQTSDNVVFFEFNAEDGNLEFLTMIACKRPTCILIKKII